MCFPETTLSCCFCVKGGVVNSTSVTALFVSKQAKIAGIARPVKELISHWAPVKSCLVGYVVVLAVLMQDTSHAETTPAECCPTCAVQLQPSAWLFWHR